jgi:hypothetical protein
MADTVTTVTVYMAGAKEKLLAQPGFYERLRELVVEFGADSDPGPLIAIEESEV